MQNNINSLFNKKLNNQNLVKKLIKNDIKLDYHGKHISTGKSYLSYQKNTTISIEDYLKLVLEIKGPSTRNDLVKKINLPRTTLYDNLMNISYKFTLNCVYSRGRPEKYFALPKSVFYQLKNNFNLKSKILKCFSQNNKNILSLPELSKISKIPEKQIYESLPKEAFIKENKAIIII